LLAAIRRACAASKPEKEDYLTVWAAPPDNAPLLPGDCMLPVIPRRCQLAFLALFGAACAIPANLHAAPPAEKAAAASAARFSPSELPADRDGSSILSTPAPGRYSIRGQSPSGARIELVDMIEGPLESAGAPGGKDGRIDALLDKGAYKLRVFGAKGASGKTKLLVAPFTELNAKRPALAAGQTQNGELADMQQRSYALEVGPEGRVFVEAIGRSLADMRLWRDNGELVDLSFEKRGVETKPGRAMTRIRLDGPVAPGRYVVTAYGGEGPVWTEGDKPQPFYLRLDAPRALDAGVVEGAIGPFGSARFLAPASYNAFRLDAPQPAPLRLEARRGNGSVQSGEIAKNNRDPFAVVALSSDDKQPALLEVSGYEGQAFALRAVRRDQRYAFEGSGPYLVGVDVAGQGGDEIPATALFARIEKDGKTRVVASDTPRIAKGRPWRGKFNLRGTTSLLFEATDAGPVAIDVKGVATRAVIDPAFGGDAARVDGKVPTKYDLAAGYYLLTLDPVDGAAGVVDVTLGTPGVAGPAPVAPPARQTISFGERQLEKESSYLILANVSPQLLVGPRVVALPADLSKAPVALWQGDEETIKLPTRAPKNGKIVAHDAKGAEVVFAQGPFESQGDVETVTLSIPPSGAARAVGVAFVADPAAPEPAKSEEDKGEEKTREAKRPARGRAPLSAVVGRPIYFDLNKDETQELRFELPEGGLYRVETLGRLQTRLKIGAAVAANLGEGENNGPGHNGLVTTYLRAGAYRANVTAVDSSGRLGFSVAKAALVETPKLVGDGGARATLGPGKGAAIPFEIADDGRYRIDLLGLDRTWRARLEDGEGWPLAKPGKLSRLTRKFDKGAYRLVVSPEDVEARMAARLQRLETDKELTGHGPHALPFELVKKLQWREPQAQGAPRDPDVWRFRLYGDSEITLSLSEGMIGEIFRGEKESVGKVAAGRDFTAKLGAGDYRVEARALSRDDRLDYEISLSSKELQPAVPRQVNLPAKVNFALAKESLVDLTSFGDKPLLGALKNAKGEIVEQLSGRANDWNIALARRLPAGAYRLELQPLGINPTTSDVEDEAREPEDGGEGADTSETNADSNDDAWPAGVELRLALPAETDDGALPAINARKVTGPGAHVLALPQASSGTLALVSALSGGEVGLSIERKNADGSWSVVGTRRGLSPFAAWPASDAAPWRVVAWSIGGAGAPIDLAFRAVDRSGEALGEIALKPVASMSSPPCVGLANLPGPTVVELADPPVDLVAGSAPGRLLEPAKAGVLAAQSKALWLAASGECREKAVVKALDWRGGEIALDLGPGERAEAVVPLVQGDKARLWIARSSEGHVGLDAGRGMAAAKDATLALAGDKTLRLWNAGGEGTLRLALRAVEVEIAPAAPAGPAYRAVIPAMTAQPVTLDIGDAALAMEAPANVALLSAPGETSPVAVFSGSEPLAATFHGALSKAPKLWLVNLGSEPAPIFLGAAPGPRAPITTARATTQFFGAAGALMAPVDAAKGDTLIAIGGDARFVGQGGEIREGGNIALDGPGVVTLNHGPGLAALWIERAGKGPWPEAPAKPLAPPQRVALQGPSARFALKLVAPALLSARSGAPALVAFAQNGRRETQAFAQGVALTRFAAAGEATLDLYPPYDGPLAGALDVFLVPPTEAREGVNEPITLAPGGAALFAFEVKRESEIGVGLRADPDVTSLRLYAADGALVAEGVAFSKKLAPGRYFIEARAPVDAPAASVRLSLFGLTPPPAGPPEDVVADYLEKAGLKKSKTR
jgi:hypothetical protein